MKDILLLGKIKQLERSEAAEVILVDAPASGHAVTFLKSARGLLDAVQMGAIHTQATEVLELLTDENRCEVLLATLAEETPVNELIETAYALEEEVGIKLGPVLVNAVYPQLALPANLASATAGCPPSLADALSAAAWFRQRRPRTSRARSPASRPRYRSPNLLAPLRFSSQLTRADLEAIADAIETAVQRLPGGAVERQPCSGSGRSRPDHRLCRIGWRGQDHHGRGAGGGRGPPGTAHGGGHHRPSPAAGRRYGPRTPRQRPVARAGPWETAVRSSP